MDSYGLMYMAAVMGNQRTGLDLSTSSIGGEKAAVDILREVAKAVSNRTGRKFLDSLVISLGDTLDAEYVFVAGLVDDGKAARTVSLCVDGEIEDNIQYDLAGTPCANVAGNDTCVHNGAVAQEFPEDLLLVQMEVDAYTGSPLFDSNGKAIGLLVALKKAPFENVELVAAVLEVFAGRAGSELERQRSEAALIQSETRFKNYIDESPTAVFIVDEKGNYRFVNSAACKITGYSLNELLRMNISELVHPDLAEQTMATFPVLLSEGKIKAEIALARKNGTRIDMILDAVKLSETEYMGFCTDISEQKQMQSALAQHEDEVREAYSSVLDAVTAGKLSLINASQVESVLGSGVVGPFQVGAFDALAASRNFIREAIQNNGFCQKLTEQILIATGEAITNGVKHGGACEVLVEFTPQDVAAGALRVQVKDTGRGIDFATLPKATLVPGFSTMRSLGMGFTIMLDLCRKVYLSTGDTGTTIVLEFECVNDLVAVELDTLDSSV